MMKRNLKLNTMLVAGVFSIFCGTAQALPQTASTKYCKPLIDTTKKAPQISPQGLPERVHRRMNRALESLTEERYDEAIEQLNRLFESARNDYVRATVSLNLAFAHTHKGDQDGSLPHFINALKFGETALPHERVQSVRQSVASLMYSLGKNQQALNTMLSWLENSVVHEPKAYAMIAALYAELNQTSDAVCPSYWSVKTSATPNKTYYQNLLKFHWDLKDMEGSAKLLKEMVKHFPHEKSFWRQLSQIYLHLDKLDDALAIMEMFYLRGEFDKNTDYKLMSQLFSNREIPLRAAKVLEEGILKKVVADDKTSWASVAQNYHISNELDNAILAYGKTAALSDKGSEYLKQAEILTDRERYNEAIIAFDNALEKGGMELEEEGRTFYRKGTTLISMGKCNAGKGVLEQARKYKQYSTQAGQWIDFANDRIRSNKC